MTFHKSAILVFLFSLILITTPVTAITAQDDETAFTAQDLEIDLGADFFTQAQLTLPTDGEAPYPLVILVHGSGPYDMDATYRASLDGDVLSTNFLTMAQTLPEDGIAVMRYNKRGVLPEGEIDLEQVQASTLDRLVADLDAVVNVAQSFEEIGEVYLYGWSEGAWVVSNMAMDRDDITGLILQGAPDDDLASLLPHQLEEITLPYLRQTTDTDADGALTLDEIAAIPPGVAAYHAGFFLYDPNATADNPMLNTFVNQNADDAIAIDDELVPAVAMYLSNASSLIPQGNSSYDTATLIAEQNIPVLLLHGALDGWVPLASAERIAETENATLEVFPELGHALSETESLALDAFMPIADAPLDVLAAWINGR